MNIDQLKAFHKVALTGGFTKAARELFLTQPAVSRQVHALESSFGTRLFDRFGKKVKMTREGEILLQYTKQLFSLYEEIETVFGQMRGLKKGKINIGSSSLLGTYFLPQIIGCFNKEYPGIEIDLRIANSNAVLNMVLEGVVDLGFASMVTTDPRLKSIFIHREKLVMVCSPDNPLADKKSVSSTDIENIPFIWREKGTQIRKLLEKWFEKKLRRKYPQKFIELENMEAAKRIVEAGYGITVFSEPAVRQEISMGKLKRVNLEGFNLSIDFYLFYLKGKTFGRADEAFQEMLLSSNLLSHPEELQSHLKRLSEEIRR
jgi:DNA-binding transcriptional LysR family regulator